MAAPVSVAEIVAAAVRLLQPTRPPCRHCGSESRFGRLTITSPYDAFLKVVSQYPGSRRARPVREPRLD